MITTEDRIKFRQKVILAFREKVPPVNLGLLLGLLVTVESDVKNVPYVYGPIFSFRNRAAKEAKYKIVRFNLLGWFAFQHHVSKGNAVTGIQHIWKGQYANKKKGSIRGMKVAKGYALSSKVVSWAEMSEEFHDDLFELEHSTRVRPDSLRDLEEGLYKVIEKYL